MQRKLVFVGTVRGTGAKDNPSILIVSEIFRQQITETKLEVGNISVRTIPIPIRVIYCPNISDTMNILGLSFIPYVLKLSTGTGFKVQTNLA